MNATPDTRTWRQWSVHFGSARLKSEVYPSRSERRSRCVTSVSLSSRLARQRPAVDQAAAVALDVLGAAPARPRPRAHAAEVRRRRREDLVPVGGPAVVRLRRAHGDHHGGDHEAERLQVLQRLERATCGRARGRRGGNVGCGQTGSTLMVPLQKQGFFQIGEKGTPWHFLEGKSRLTVAGARVRRRGLVGRPALPAPEAVVGEEEHGLDEAVLLPKDTRACKIFRMRNLLGRLRLGWLEIALHRSNYFKIDSPASTGAGARRYPRPRLPHLEL